MRSAWDRRGGDRTPAGTLPIGLGGYVIGTQTVPVEIQKLADDVSRAIVDNADRIAAAQGEIALVAHREAGRFGRLTLKATTLLVPSRQRFDSGQINRLAADARAKILAEAASIGATVNVVTLRIHSRGQGYVIGLGVEF